MGGTGGHAWEAVLEHYDDGVLQVDVPQEEEGEGESEEEEVEESHLMR